MKYTRRDALVITAELQGTISTNPDFQFEASIEEAGTFTFTWLDDNGSVYNASKDIALA